MTRNLTIGQYHIMQPGMQHHAVLADVAQCSKKGATVKLCELVHEV